MPVNILYEVFCVNQVMKTEKADPVLFMLGYFLDDQNVPQSNM